MDGGAGAADADADDAADDEDEDEDDEDEAQRCFYQRLGLRPIYTSGGLSLYTIVRSPWSGASCAMWPKLGLSGNRVHTGAPKLYGRLSW